MSEKVVHKIIQEVKDNLEVLPISFAYLKPIKRLNESNTNESKKELEQIVNTSVSVKISQIDVYQSNYCIVSGFYKPISRVMQKISKSKTN